MNLGVGGRTESGLAVSRLGFGTAGLGRSLSRGERLRLLETAFDSGITYFDTAPLYGAGAAEEALGAFLRGAPDGVTVATKAGILPAPVAALVLSRLVGRTAVGRAGWSQLCNIGLRELADRSEGRPRRQGRRFHRLEDVARLGYEAPV